MEWCCNIQSSVEWMLGGVVLPRVVLTSVLLDGGGGGVLLKCRDGCGCCLALGGVESVLRNVGGT